MPKPHATITLTEKDNGATVTVKPGSTIDVVLPSNPSTGFTWYPATERYPLGRPEIKTIATGPIIPGASVVETRTYKVTPAMIGAHRIQLEYKRTSDPSSVAPAKIFLFNILVT